MSKIERSEMIMSLSKFLKTPYSNEDQFTVNANRFINNNYPQYRRLYAHIPNESQYDQHRTEGRFGQGDLHRIKLASMGVLPGFPDFIFLPPSVWFIELKMPNGVLNENQKLLFPMWSKLGYEIYVCYNPLQVAEIMKDKWGRPAFN